MVTFTLKQLRYFVTVAEAEGITAASRLLHIAQPSLSAAIAQLESALDVQLFVRHKARGLSLTSSGHRFLAEARRLLAHAEEVAQGAADLSHSLRGPLEVGCFTTFGPVFLPRLLNGFAAAYPEIIVRFHEAAIDELQNLLLGGGCEQALLYDIELSDRLEWQVLAEAAPYVLLADHHPLAKKHAVSLEALADLSMILLDLPHSREYFRSIFLTGGLEPTIRQRTGNVETLRGLVANGDCFSLLNLPSFSELDYAGRRLVSRPLTQRVSPLKIVLAWARGARTTARAQAFGDHCRDFFAGLDPVSH